MQFIEVNSFEVRSAVHQLERRGETLRFVLFPMIHIGEKSYYEDIAARASRCDLLLVEGVPSIWARIATRSYALFAARLGLVTQLELDLRALRPKVINTDLSAEEFDAAHAELPVAARMILPLFLPLAGLYFLLRGNRELLAEQLETSDLPNREEILSASEATDALDDLLLSRRDRAFLLRLQSLFEDSRGKSITIGIIYGAAHMPAIFRFLSDQLHYRVVDSSWSLVFSLYRTGE